jgi:tetratricopeptide (TPR) repeat protein
MSSQHQRAKDLFIAALDQAPADRPAFLAEACGDDVALRAEVESLLGFHDEHEDDEPLAPPSEPTFSPGEVFAGRYRMITRLGRGGIGDVWRADDLVLGTAVALKLIPATGPVGRERLLNEVRLARQITHPNICRVFDVGEADGWVFFSMELVRGEDLAALLRRVGRLPSEKVTDVARQLCAGLAAAHAQGVLHRDLKPANVLIDNDGVVRLSDFGIAIPRTDAGAHFHTGTPGYMAPEQRTAGGALSERTDLYSLGLVLYELLTGRHPLQGRDRHVVPPPPSSIVPNVDPRLQRVVMQMLALEPAQRPASAGTVAAALPEPGTRPGTAPVLPAVTRDRRATWWLAGLGMAAIVAVAAIASSFFVTPGARTLTERDTIVLADFENTTGDTVFDGALKVALAVALEQSPFLQVFPDNRARDTLQLMERSPDERITRPIAREIARRERLKALIAGSIVSLGRNYVLGIEAINAETGDVMAREQAEAGSKEDVLTALGAASARLRERLGESLASVQKFDVALPRATTPSLDALHAYALALDEGRAVPRLEAVPHLKRALELDPTFAMAHALLSGVYANTGQSSLAPEFSRRAFELRDRVSERERYYISWRYYRDANQDWEKALELARSWTATYPREAFAFNSLGVALIRVGRFEDSVEPFNQAIRLDPKFTPAYSNLAATYLALNRYAEARGILKQAADLRLDFIGARRLSYLIAFVQGDEAIMARELAASVGVGETNAAFGWQAHASAFGGRARLAHEQFGRGIQMSLQGNFDEVASQLTMEDAENHATVGQCAEVRAEVTRGLALSRDNGTLERASRALALCGDPEAARIAAELSRRFPDATLTNRAAVPIANAALALARNEPARTLQLLAPVDPYDRAPSTEFWPAYLRGQAQLQLGDASAARAAFESILARRGEVPASPLFPLAHLGVARAAVRLDDLDRARTSYERFFELWKNADPDLRILREARAEAARLPRS